MGSGWLFAPLQAAQSAGPAALVSWSIGGVAMILLALTFAEVSSMLPVSGGIARIPHFTHGNVTSMVMGWTAWLGYNTAAPIEVLVILEYSGHWLPWIFTKTGGPETMALSPLGYGFTALLLLIFTLFNAWSARFFANLNSFITWFKLVIPVLIGGFILYHVFRPANFTEYGGFAPYGWVGIFGAVSSGGIIFAFLGFRHVIDLAGEAKRPQLFVPLALVFSILICMVVYLLLQGAFIGALDADNLSGGWSKVHFADLLGPLAGILAGLGIVWLTTTLYVGSILGPFGGALVATGSNARLARAMSHNGFFPHFLDKLTSRGIPLRALVLNYFVGLILVVSVPFREIIALNTSAIVLSLTVGPVAVVALRAQLPDHKRLFQLPAVRLLAAAAMTVATWILYWSGWDTAWRLLMAVALGFVVFAFRYKNMRSGEPSLDFRSAFWMLPYMLGVGLLTWLGPYGGGMDWLPFGWDLLAGMLLAMAALWLAQRCRLPSVRTHRYLKNSHHELGGGANRYP